MTIAIYPSETGATAFLHQGSRAHVVMISGSPRVEWSFDATTLQAWLTTLEEVLATEGIPHMPGLRDIHSSIQGAYARHLQEHDAVVTEAPSADDLQAYLASYAAAMNGPV